MTSEPSSEAIRTIEVPVALTPEDLANVLQISVKTARKEFSQKPTFTVGRRRRMTWATVQKYYFDKSA
jgi:hypothetical protein